MIPLSFSDQIQCIFMFLNIILLVRIATSPDAYFHTPFYIFFITTGVCGIFSMVSFMFGFRFDLTRSWEWIYKLVYVINYEGAIGAMVGKLIIVIHRYSVLNNGEMSENKWSRSLIYRLVAVQFILPLATFIPFYFFKYKYVTKVGVGDVVDVIGGGFTDEDIVMAKIISIGCYSFYIIASIILTALTSRSLAKLSAIVGEGNTRRQIIRQQKTMFIIVSFCVLSHFIKAVHQALWGLLAVLHLPEAAADVWPFYSYANGLAMYTSPVILIICSSKVRRLFIPKCNAQSSSVGNTQSGTHEEGL